MITMISLRSILTRAACAGLAAILMTSAGCDKKESASSTGGSTTAASDKTTIGFLYVGTKDDNGYNQAHADGAAAVKAAGFDVVQVESVAENKDCEQTMASMAEQNNASIIFATSFGYFPHVKEVAPKYPKVMFLHAGGQPGPNDPPNVGEYFAYIDELEYLCGMAAGASTKTGKLGYIAAKPITPVLRDINAFELGAKSINPSATLTVIFTGDWFQPTKEADAVGTLADSGVDVVSGHVDSPKAFIQAAEKRGLMSCGYHYNGASLAPKGYLTGAEWNWGPMYVQFVNDIKAGKPLPHGYMGSVKTGAVKLSAYGPLVTAETQAKIEAVKAQMIAGTFKMFKGPLKDNTGAVVIPEGTEFDDQAGELWGMKYLVEGVIGNTGSK